MQAIVALIIVVLLFKLGQGLFEWASANPGPVIALGAIVGGLIAVARGVRSRNERLRREEAAERERILNEVIESADDDIARFARAHIPPERAWPADIHVSDEDLRALGSILSSKGIDLAVGDLRSRSNYWITCYQQELFAKSFQKYSVALGPLDSFESYVAAYVTLFGNRTNQIYYFARMLDALGVAHEVSVGSAIGQQYAWLVEQRRIDAVQRAMLKGDGDLGARIRISDTDDMDGIGFEKLLARLFGAMGYAVEQTIATGDQGADLIVEKFGDRTAVQAKCYSDRVSNSAVQEVVSARAYYRCTSALVVTNSTFTKSAVELAMANDVELWDRDKLATLLSSFM